MASAKISEVAAAEAVAAAAAAAEAASASTAVSDRVRLVLGAAFEVFLALCYICVDVASEVFMWVSAHSGFRYSFYLATLVALVYIGVRIRVARDWESGLKESQVARGDVRVKRGSSKWEDLLEDDEPPSSDEDVGGVTRGPRPLRAGDGEFTRLRSTSGVVHTDSAASVLRQCRALADDLGEECLSFLEERVREVSFGPDEVVFGHESLRQAFIIVKSGQVLVEARPQAEGRREEYTIEAGEPVVGLLFLLATLEAGGQAPPPPDICRCHHSAARAGRDGAQVVELPTSAFAELFEKYPDQVFPMVQRLCSRLGLVVFEAMHTYFGLRCEAVCSSSYSALDLEPEALAKIGTTESDALTPAMAFERLLGFSSCESGKSGESIVTNSNGTDVHCEVTETFSSASTLVMEAGQYVFQRQQRAGKLLILLEGDLRMDIRPAGLASRPRGDVRRAAAAAAAVAEKIPFATTTVGPVAQDTSPAAATDWDDFNDAIRVPCGHAVGELSLLVDGPTPVTYRCATRCRFAVLPRDAVVKLLDSRPRLMCLRMLHLVAARCATWLHRVDAALDWSAVEGGRSLYRKGDKMIGFFVVLSGRLYELEEQVTPEEGTAELGHASRWRVTGVFQRGRLCGELDCLRDQPYSKTVRAARDAEVCRVSSSLLHLIASEFPKAILHFSALCGPASTTPTKLETVTITVVPANSRVQIRDVCMQLTRGLGQLGKALHVSPDSDLTQGSLHMSGRRRNGGAARSLAGPRLARLLADLEERCRWVVYEAEPNLSDWTRRCIRQADHILVANVFDGTSRGDVPQTSIEEYLDEFAPQYVERDLLLLHEVDDTRGRARDDWSMASASSADRLRPGIHNLVKHHTQLFFEHGGSNAKRSTRHYLNTRPWAARWHHVRPTEMGDWARCARLLAGRGVGLCLGGGGARGAIHFGLIQALQELGVPIDVVSGTSFGALAGGMYCSTSQKPEALRKLVERVLGQYFSIKSMLLDFNFPRTAYFTGSFLNYVLQNTFARRRCEDLLIPFACTTCDIANFQAKIHTSGPLWRVVRASMSLVGFVPPLPFQERRPEDGKIVNSLLVDGGYVNQYPIEVLKEMGAGVVICCVACPDYEPVATNYGDVVRGGLISLRRMLGCRREGPDPPTQAEIQERLMFLVESMKESHSSRSDITITAPIQPFGLLDFAKYKEIRQVGYDAARPQLETWLASGGKAAQKVNELIKAARDDEKPRDINEVEYGGRRAYALWRKVRATSLETGTLRRRFQRRFRRAPEDGSSDRCRSSSLASADSADSAGEAHAEKRRGPAARLFRRGRSPG
eukprot:TRINITY_DN27160_c0_g5_i1.p1 TRINITY_DN27160_c0_g5~~TRINITY_DN27160_c0_g5_i1.p1  ORF type:complete len:1313 (-),score=181.21 TRINITY_DN27160_c0_g5_i1:67-4005(-)